MQQETDEKTPLEKIQQETGFAQKCKLPLLLFSHFIADLSNELERDDIVVFCADNPIIRISSHSYLQTRFILF